MGEGYKNLASHFSYSHSNEATNDSERMHENAEKNVLAAKSNPFFVRPESVRVHSLSLPLRPSLFLFLRSSAVSARGLSAYRVGNKAAIKHM